MRVAVIGAGVVGVTTAFELAVDGHVVTVFERRPTVASEGSFANAGFIAPTCVAHWAAPSMPGKVLRHLLGRHSPVQVGWRLNLSTVAWLAQWRKACHAEPYRANRVRMHRLARYSLDRLHELTRRCHLEYERSDGALVLLRGSKDVALAEANLAALAEFGVAVTRLDAAACRSREPGLNPDTPLQAGLLTADDEVANCRQFTHLLKREASALGVQFRFGAEVRRIESGAPPTIAYDTASSDGEEAFDAVVVCAALGSAALLRPLGIRLPLQAVFGYSLTAPLRQDDPHRPLEPRAALMDERYKVAISRFGTRVRVAGCAEIGGAANMMNRRAAGTLDKVCTTGFRVSRSWPGSNSGRARARCFPTGRRCSVRAAHPACGSISVMAAAAGRWHAARPVRWPMRSAAGAPRSTSKVWASKG